MNEAQAALTKSPGISELKRSTVLGTYAVPQEDQELPPGVRPRDPITPQDILGSEHILLQPTTIPEGSSVRPTLSGTINSENQTITFGATDYGRPQQTVLLADLVTAINKGEWYLSQPIPDSDRPPSAKSPVKLPAQS